MKKLLILSAIALFIAGISSQASAQDFQKSYHLAPNGVVTVRNVSGNISITGYAGTEILVSGTKEGTDTDKVSVDDQSTDGRVDLRVTYPRNCNCNASINFKIQVPQATAFNFERLSTASGDIQIQSVTGQVVVSSASGDVAIDGVTGQVTASTASGDIHLKRINGSASARAASGDVEAELTQVNWAGDMQFTTASGDVKVQLPASVDADVEMATMSGDLNTDFPLDVKQPIRGSARTAAGRLGSGAHRLKISSASGTVSLKRS